MRERRLGVTAAAAVPDAAAAAVFGEDGHGLFLRSLFGMECGFCGSPGGPARIRGLFRLRTEEGRFEADDLPFRATREGPDRLTAVGRAASLDVTTEWTLDGGVLARTDEVQNGGSTPVVVLSAAARFCLSPAAYEVYAQSSRWCRENQGAWSPLQAGGIRLANEGGRSCQGAAPFACIRDAGSGRGLALHVVSRGDWRIDASLRTAGLDSRFAAVIEAGQAETDLRLVLAPGESVRLPEILLYALPDGRPEEAAPVLHAYLLRTRFRAPDAARDALPDAARDALPPIAYNTWFHRFDDLDPARLRPQLEAARAAGCEVFTVDAGWYGAGPGGWAAQTGDWRERTDGAFHGRMADFAREVRAAGLGFGLWMEPERCSAGVPAVREHPDWFLPGEGGSFWPRLAHRPAYDWVKSEMARLAAAYELAWMKIDFNFDMRCDPTGSGFLRHYEAWSRLLSEFRSEFPCVFLEGCASGGLRSDLWGLLHCDAHFLSDTVNPVDMIRILQGAALRVPPCRIALWAVLRPAGNRIPVYGALDTEGAPGALAPQGAVWDHLEVVDPSFACAAAMPGVPGLGGDIAGLCPEHREAVRRSLSFYKTWRSFIRRAVCHPLTPPRPKEDRTGWAALELMRPGAVVDSSPGAARNAASNGDGTRLVFLYRLDDGNHRMRFPLKGLPPARRYRVADAVSGGEGTAATGAELADGGIEASLPARFRALVLSVVPEAVHRSP